MLIYRDFHDLLSGTKQSAHFTMRYKTSAEGYSMQNELLRVFFWISNRIIVFESLYSHHQSLALL